MVSKKHWAPTASVEVGEVRQSATGGRVDIYFERHMWPWDAVAGLALIRASGGDHAPFAEASRGAGGLVLAGGKELVRKTAAIVTKPRGS